jgi:predicted O-methyltransferase YrrM
MNYNQIFFRIQSYLKFLYYSKNQHGIHSPFVFALVTQCFYNNTKNEAYKTLKNIRNYLYTSYQTIYVTDFGAGSKVFKNNKRKVSAIAKNAGLSQKNSKLLFRIVAYFKPTHILEIGTSVGLATVSMALDSSKTQLITLEGCPETAKIAQDVFDKFKLKNIKIDIGEFNETIQKYTTEKLDFIYFDGNHQYEATLQYFNKLLPTITNETVWIFDDIHWSSGMEKAWEVIKNHPKVTVTIDTFQWGIVFFRTEQAKEHFVVRV